MTASRLLAAATLLTATLTLAACGPEKTPSSTSASPSFSASATAPTSAPVGASASPTGSTHPSRSASPAADCTANAKHPGHQVINVTAASGTQLTATATNFICGPDVPDDGYYQVTGPASSYTLAPGAVTEIVVLGSGPDMLHKISLDQFDAHVKECSGHGCFGNNYDITVDPAGHITHISELYHP